MAIFVSRKNQKKPEQKGRRLLLLACGAAGVMLSASLFFYVDWPAVLRAAERLRDAFVDHGIFAVREIKVKGGEKVGGSEVVTMARVSHGVSIWKVDPEAIEKRVARHPWVRRVVARREFPRRVVIEVEEREVKAIAILGKPYYVDRDGFIFKAVEEGEKMDFPLFTGLQSEDLTSPTSFASRQRIQQALQLSDLMGKDALGLSEIRFLPQGGLIVYPMSVAVPVQMGWGHWEEKLKRLEQVLALWEGLEDRLAGLDVSFGDQVVAKLKKG